MTDYEVLSSVISGEVDFGDSKMTKVETTLKPVDGGDAIQGVMVWRKAGYPIPMEGETWEGQVENAPKGGLKLARPRNTSENGSPPPANAIKAPPTPRGRTDATGRSIERQVALKAAVELAVAGEVTGTSTVLAIANAFDAWLKGESDVKPDDGIPF